MPFYQDDMFHLFFVNDNYYFFFRLHQLLCERLLKMYQQSVRLIEQESRESNETNAQRQQEPSVATLLRLSSRRKSFHASPLITLSPLAYSQCTRRRLLSRLSRHGTKSARWKHGQLVLRRFPA